MTTSQKALLKADRIVEFANNALVTIQPLLEDRRTGCAITLTFDGEDFAHRTTAMLGVPSLDKKSRYWSLSREKADRLEQQREHVSSAQSADEENERYPGAIRTGRWIVSISGFKALDDEAFALALACKAGLLLFRDAEKIGDISGSTGRFDRMYAALPMMM